MIDLKKHQESKHKEFFDKYEKYDTKIMRPHKIKKVTPRVRE